MVMKTERSVWLFGPFCNFIFHSIKFFMDLIRTCLISDLGSRSHLFLTAQTFHVIYSLWMSTSRLCDADGAVIWLCRWIITSIITVIRQPMVGPGPHQHTNMSKHTHSDIKLHVGISQRQHRLFYLLSSHVFPSFTYFNWAIWRQCNINPETENSINSMFRLFTETLLRQNANHRRSLQTWNMKHGNGKMTQSHDIVGFCIEFLLFRRMKTTEIKTKKRRSACLIDWKPCINWQLHQSESNSLWIFCK